MKTAVAVTALALLFAAGSVQAGVFRCADAKGRTYFSDKGCDPGDKAAEARGGGTVTVIDSGAEFKGKARNALTPGGNKKSGNGQVGTNNRYVQRAQNTQQKK